MTFESVDAERQHLQTGEAVQRSGDRACMQVQQLGELKGELNCLLLILKHKC